MAEVRQKMRGTTAELDAVTSLVGHLVYDTQSKDLRVYDGVTPGGFKFINLPNLATNSEVVAYNSTRLGGQLGSFYQNASNLNAGTIADARLPTVQSGKTFAGLTQISDGTFLIRSVAPIIQMQESDNGDKNWYIVADGGTFSVREGTLGVDRLNILSGGDINALRYNGAIVWHSANDGYGSGLDSDLLEGQHGSFYQNASNLNAGTIPDARLPHDMAAKRFDGGVYVNSSINTHLIFQQNSVTRFMLYYDVASASTILGQCDTSGAWIRGASFRQSDGRFTVPAEFESGATLIVGADARIYTDGNIKFAGAMAATYGGHLSQALADRVKNDGGTYNINISGSARFVRTVGGQTLNFDWNGQSGQPSWLWGGNDGYNMYVYNPANFHVYHSQFCGDADKVDGAHLVDIVVPPGAVTHFARDSAPNGWLKANGAAVSRTTYAALFNAIGTMFGAGDGWSTFNLPDMRGVFARSWDDSRGIDAGRGFGTWQDDALQHHRHMYGQPNATGSGSNTIGAGPDSNQYYSSWATDARLATETRPKNIALLACIKY